jgi:protein phosphatase
MNHHRESAPGLAAAAASLHWSGVTHSGRFRPNNEDSFLGLKFDGREVSHLGKTGHSPLAGADFVFAVSDGLGGARSGEFASRIAMDRISQLLPRVHRRSSTGKNGLSEALGGLFAAIHADMLHLGNAYAECRGMGTTLSLCWFRPGWLHFGHIGDSRIYHLPGKGALTQLTPDHTHVGWLRRKGEISEREARSHPGRNALNQALGAGHQFLEPHIGALAHRPGDRFLICSDGLVEGLWDHRIDFLLRQDPPGSDGPSIAEWLVSEAVQASGRDNATAIVVEIPASAGPGAAAP